MIIVRLPRQSGTGNIYGNEQTAESRERDSAVTLFGPGDYCALTFSPLLIAERLGHEKVQTTMDTYSHLYPNKQVEVARQLDGIMP